MAEHTTDGMDLVPQPWVSPFPNIFDQNKSSLRLTDIDSSVVRRKKNPQPVLDSCPVVPSHTNVKHL